MGKNILSAVLVVSIIGTAIADLGYMHASNVSWPPHAKLHAVWSVLHTMGVQSLALGVLWIGAFGEQIVRIRIAILILFMYVSSFFVSLVLAPLFGAAITPDLPLERMPPTLLGLDGNVISMLVATPLIVWIWWQCEIDARKNLSQAKNN